MKAAQINAYAKNFKMMVNDIPQPTLASTEVLVKVAAAAVNPLENLIGTGSVRLIQDYQFPQTMGNELTGTIVDVGADVSDLAVGDEIYSRLPLGNIGAFAEYVAIDAAAVAPLPKTLNLITAAAVPLTGLTAYQALHDTLHAEAGKTLFIPGGSGSFGQMAIPIAKVFGLHVIVSGSAAAKERTLASGADEFLDYKTQNYWELLKPVDYVIDTLGPRELDHELSIIKPGGQLLSLRMGPNKQFGIDHQYSFWKRQLFAMAGRKIDRLAAKHQITYHFLFVESSGAELRTIAKIIDDNHIAPAIDPTLFTIDQVNDALALVTSGHPKGKVVIRF